MIHHTSGPRNKNLIDVRKNFVLSSYSRARDLYRPLDPGVQAQF